VDREYVQREIGPGCWRDTVESYRRSWIFALGRARIGYAWYVRIADQTLHHNVLVHSEQDAEQLCGAVTTALVLAAVPDDGDGPAGMRHYQPQIRPHPL
jgi:hypothetical protein